MTSSGSITMYRSCSVKDNFVLNGLEPFWYLADLLKRLPGHKVNQVVDLPPFKLPK